MTSGPPKPSNPFAALESLRANLPVGAAPNVATPAAEKPAKREFGEKVVVRFTRKGHGGKTVTVITGVLPHALDSMCVELKKAMGCGARVEDGAIVLQGELVDRACAWLEKRGAKKLVRG